MKIAIVMPLAEQRGGAEIALLHLMQQGRNAGIEWLVVFLQQGPMVAQLQDLGIETQVVSAGRMRQAHRFASAVRQIAHIARSRRADLILGWMGKAHIYGCWAGRLARIPVLWYQHGLPSRRSRMDRWIARLPSCGILACSRTVQEAQLQLPPRRPMRVVYPGCEIERFDAGLLPSPLEARHRLGLPLHGPLIGIVGRLQRWKGIHTFIEAMPAILRTYPDAHGLIVGGKHDLEPDYPAYLQQRIDALGLAQQILLAGLQRNVPEWMQAMDIIVHASDTEPFGIVVIEAMALGKPIVAGAAGGPSEVITPERNGLTAPYGDAQALAAAVLRYLGDPAFACRLAAAARSRALEFSTQHYARSLIRAVQELYPSRG